MKAEKKTKERKVAEAAAAKRVKDGTLKKDQIEGYSGASNELKYRRSRT
jgi:hypothetical protein